MRTLIMKVIITIRQIIAKVRNFRQELKYSFTRWFVRTFITKRKLRYVPFSYTIYRTPSYLPLALINRLSARQSRLTLGFESWEDWEKKTKAKHPIQFFFRKKIPQFYKRTLYTLRTLPLTLKQLLFKPANQITIRSFNRVGFYEADTKLTTIMVQIFLDYVENSYLFERIDFSDHSDIHTPKYLTMFELYLFFKLDYPTILANSPSLDTLTFTEYMQKVEETRVILDFRFKQLIELREYLSD